MTETTRPTKQQVRDYLERRTHAPLEPPPDADEIRRQLGWWLIPENKRPDQVDKD
ncbi:MAG: hypothetical protein K2X55_04075 [Burkholderiaceae bacterium]|nr:hypothetical protein [Burkholderiaceae bacterium]